MRRSERDEAKGLAAAPLGGAIGAFGLAIMSGTCGSVCSAAVLPVGALLGSLGLAGLGAWTATYRAPLLTVAFALGAFALWSLVRRGKALAAAGVGLLMGAGIPVAVGALDTGTPSVPYSALNVAAIQPGPDANVGAIGLQDFRSRFNADKDKLRIVTLLSPTCGGCIEGHEVFSKVFERTRSAALQGYVVWLPMMKEDSFEAAADLAGTISDDRITDYWDKDRAIGIAFTGTLGLDRTAWDIYAVYPPGAVWDESKPPPKPAFWMHQLWGMPKENFLDGAVLSRKVDEMVTRASL